MQHAQTGVAVLRQKLDGQLVLRGTCSLMHWGNRNSTTKDIALISQRANTLNTNNTFVPTLILKQIPLLLLRNSWIYLVQTFIPFVSLLNNFIRSNRIKFPIGRQLQQVELVTACLFLLQTVQFCLKHCNNLFLCAALFTIANNYRTPAIYHRYYH